MNTIGSPAASLTGGRLFRTRFLLAVLLFFSVQFSSQAQDTLPVKSKSDSIAGLHSPHKASIFSAVLPGLGQAYNHKYWKIPIVYAGFGTMGYFISFNTKYYKLFRDAYAYKTSGSTATPVNELAAKYPAATLLTARDYYRRNLEISYIATGVWYILNIVDATVDAHFFNYNINDDLSLQVQSWVSPSYAGGRQSAGLSFSLRF